MHIDAVVVQGPASLDIAEAHRMRLWPSARILFQGTPVEMLRTRKLSPTTTGLPLQHDLVGTARLALELRPATRRLCMADARELDRFGISERRLPPGCDIRFRQPSLWRDYRWYVVGALLVVALQSAMLVAFFWQRRERHRAEIEVAKRRTELAQASRLALAGELTASIAHEINQ